MRLSLFSFITFYVLVVLVLVIWFFWNDYRFFWLAAINFLSLAIFYVLHSILEKRLLKKSEDLKSAVEVQEKKIDTANTFVKYPYGHKTNHSNHKMKKRLKKIFNLILLLLLACVVVGSFFYFPRLRSIVDFSSWKIQNTDPLLLTGHGEVLSTWLVLVDTGVSFEETGEVLNTGVSDIFLGDAEIVIETGVVETWEIVSSIPETSIKDKLGITDSQNITMMDALIYLIDSNKIELNTKQDVKFTYVTTKNPNYAYWRTAYQYRIIGQAVNPSSKISCETYQVFKGMIQLRDLKYYPATVKSVFRAEAKKKDDLNGCVYGKLLKGENL